jgi:hypothetical protein
VIPATATRFAAQSQRLAVLVADRAPESTRLSVAAGQASDKTPFPDLSAALPTASTVVADRGFDGRAVVDPDARGGGALASTRLRLRD